MAQGGQPEQSGADAITEQPRKSRNTRNEEGHAGTPGARAGRKFATASASKLATAISNTLLHSLRE